LILNYQARINLDAIRFPYPKILCILFPFTEKTRTVSAGTGFEMIYKNIAIELKV